MGFAGDEEPPPPRSTTHRLSLLSHFRCVWEPRFPRLSLMALVIFAFSPLFMILAQEDEYYDYDSYYDSGGGDDYESDSGDSDIDTDGDGLINQLEFEAGTNPMLDDSDQDGVLDGREYHGEWTVTLPSEDGYYEMTEVEVEYYDEYSGETYTYTEWVETEPEQRFTTGMNRGHG